MAEYVNPNALVDSDWVAAHGGDEGVRLVEVDVDTTSYDSGHIPGAVGWNWETQLSDGVRRDIASPEQWAELLESSGISADTHVILYGDNNNWFAAFAYWQFKLAGHDRVSLMNGGRLKWEQEGHELTTAPPDVERSSYAAGEADPSLRVLQPDVRAAVGDGSTVMVDVRSPAPRGCSDGSRANSPQPLRPTGGPSRPTPAACPPSVSPSSIRFRRWIGLGRSRTISTITPI